jgi:hypothetical protein
MSTLRNLIDYKSTCLLVAGIFPLCLTLMAAGAAALHADHGLRLASGGIIVISEPEIPLPKTPPDYMAPESMERPV